MIYPQESELIDHLFLFLLVGLSKVGGISDYSRRIFFLPKVQLFVSAMVDDKPYA